MPFVSYDEVYATIQYDSSLKALLYGKMMYIETAVKNIALESILDNAKSESIQDMFDKVVSGYNNADYSGVPVWALFEIMTMGDLGYLLSCLTYDVRDDISK